MSPVKQLLLGAVIGVVLGPLLVFFIAASSSSGHQRYEEQKPPTTQELILEEIKKTNRLLGIDK